METEYIYSEIHITCYNKTHVIQESLSSNAEFRPEKNDEKKNAAARLDRGISHFVHSITCKKGRRRHLPIC